MIQSKLLFICSGANNKIIYNSKVTDLSQSIFGGFTAINEAIEYLRK